MRGMFGWFAKKLREVNRANAVMRVPELRARHTGPASEGSANGERWFDIRDDLPWHQNSSTPR